MSVTVVSGQDTRHGAGQLRSTALLEMRGGRARLVPVVIKVGDKFYDAAYYHADPIPMALGGEIVYEATRAGDSAGLFTVTGAQQVKDIWVGLGSWRPGNAAELDAKKPAPPTADKSAAADDERPILKRAKPGAGESGSQSESKPASDSSAGASGTGANSNSNAPPPSGNSQKESAPPPPATAAAAPRDEGQSERPILRRGKPQDHQSGDEMLPEIADKPGAARAAPATAKSSPGKPTAANVEVLVAVSDAKGPTPRPYTMALDPDQRAKYEALMRRQAYNAILKFAASRPDHKPAAAAAMGIDDFRVFDAHYNNEPDIVFTASLPESLPSGASTAFRYYATLAATFDIYGEPRLLLNMVTDSSHLDVYPRMQLIDIVDAEGNGGGQLLFREVSDSGYKYLLDRIGADQLWPLFESSERDY